MPGSECHRATAVDSPHHYRHQTEATSFPQTRWRPREEVIKTKPVRADTAAAPLASSPSREGSNVKRNLFEAWLLASLVHRVFGKCFLEIVTGDEYFLTGLNVTCSSANQPLGNLQGSIYQDIYERGREPHCPVDSLMFLPIST